MAERGLCTCCLSARQMRETSPVPKRFIYAGLPAFPVARKVADKFTPQRAAMLSSEGALRYLKFPNFKFLPFNLAVRQPFQRFLGNALGNSYAREIVEYVDLSDVLTGNARLTR